MRIIKIVLRCLTWWNSQTINTQFFTWRNGVKVGVDELGNIFYTSKDGLRRWVIFNGEAEASLVSPDWHGWLHHTWDELPTDSPLVKKSWEKKHQENLTGTMGSYAPSGSIRRTTPRPRSDYESWKPE
jgi:NADH:ubiquinone oxidoreductase subunit